MKLLLPLASLSLFLLSGCLVSPVSESGGPGSVTVTNSSPESIIAAARVVFPEYGYTPGPANFPRSVSFDKPAGAFGKLLYGSYGTTTTMRVTVNIIPIPETSDYRLVPRLKRVSDAGQAGFEDSNSMASLWAAEFGPVLRKVRDLAENRNPM